MKKLSTILLAAVFMFNAGASFAASNALQEYQAKRDAAIKRHDAKLNEIQKRKVIRRVTEREVTKRKIKKVQKKWKKVLTNVEPFDKI